jgi:hypothetical protein
MSIGNSTFHLELALTEIIDVNAESIKNPSVRHNNFDFGPRVFSDRSPNPITGWMYHLYEGIGTGGVEIDLTDLPQVNGGTKDATGKQLFLIRVTNKTAASKLMIQNAATNSYPIATDNATVGVSSTVAATLTKTQVGNATRPAILTLAIPSTANAGCLSLTSGFSYPAIITHDPSTTDVSAALTIVQSGAGVTNPLTVWSVAEPTAGTFVATYQFNADIATPTIALQGLLNISASAVVTSIPAWGLYPTLIPLGLQGAVVDSTHKKILLKAVSGTIDAEVTLWFIDAVA